MVGDDVVGVGQVVVRVLPDAGVADRRHARGVRATGVGAAQVADVRRGGGGGDAEAVEGVAEDLGVGLVDADLVGERPVVEGVEQAVVGEVAPQRRPRSESGVGDDADAHASRPQRFQGVGDAGGEGEAPGIERQIGVAHLAVDAEVQLAAPRHHLAEDLLPRALETNLRAVRARGSDTMRARFDELRTKLTLHMELEESLLEVNLLVEELRRKNDDYFARMWVHDVIYDPAIRAEFAVGLWEPFYWRWKAVHLRIAGEGMLMAAGGPVLRGGLGLGARLILRSAPNVTRALVAADLGLSGNGIAALEGTFIDAGGVRAMHVGYIEATSRGALLAEVRGALPNILNAARADGIRTLQISGTFANKGFSRFAAGQTTQYGGMISSVNGVETFTFILF